MKTYAILSAFPDEMKCYNRVVKNIKSNKIDGVNYKIGELGNNRVILLAVGIGTTSAATLATHLFVNFHPDAILFSGTAGGVGKDLRIGDVVIGDEIFEAEIQGIFELLPGTPFESALINPVRQEKLPAAFKGDKELLEKLEELSFDDFDIQYGTIVSTNTFPSPKSLFEKIKSRRALAIEMEGSAIYQLGWLMKVPVLVSRGISNLLNSDGSDDEVHHSNVPLAAENAARVLVELIERLG